MSRRVEPVEEVPVRLELGGRTVACLPCTPEHLDALAAGWLLGQGRIRRADEIVAIEVDAGDPAAPVVRVRCAAEAVDRPGDDGCDPLVALRRSATHRSAGRAPAPPAERFPDLFRLLYEDAVRYRETGGIHVVALCDGERLHYPVEDVGRHNAVDKVVGRAILDRADLSRLGIVLSARVSGEIALKAARAGLAWIASRSVPTTLAVQLAREAAIPIVARAPGKDARVFAEAGP